MLQLLHLFQIMQLKHPKKRHTFTYIKRRNSHTREQTNLHSRSKSAILEYPAQEKIDKYLEQYNGKMASICSNNEFENKRHSVSNCSRADSDYTHSISPLSRNSTSRSISPNGIRRRSISPNAILGG
eukprot:225133_1